MKKRIITITGDLASGKSTVVEILSKRLNYEKYSNGIYFRKLAKENNMDVTSFGKYVEKHPEIDKKIEENTGNYAKSHERLIIDARLGFYSVPESFKVYLKVKENIAVKRAFNDDKRKESENFDTMNKHKEDLRLRCELERKRYLNLYGIDKQNMNNYDLVIDTSDKTPEEVANIIEEEYKKFLGEKL